MNNSKKSILSTMSYLAVLATVSGTNALVLADQTVDPGKTWNGYMNVFEIPSNGGGYVFGSPWGAADLSAAFSPGILTLTPNINIAQNVPSNDGFWWIQSGPETGNGNKTMEANFYVEDSSLAGTNVTFSGTVQSNTLQPGWTSIAIIKEFTPSFSLVGQSTANLVTGSPFVLNLNTTAGNIIQYGFQTVGPNATLAQAVGQSVIIDAQAAVSGTEWDVDASGTWSIGSNWNPTTAPNGSTEVVNFLSKITSPQTVTVTAPTAAGTLNFNNANKYTIDGSSPLTVNTAINVVAGSHEISAPVTLVGSLPIAAAAGSTLTISGSLSGSGSLSKSGTGSLVLTGPVTHTGSTTVTGGVLTTTNAIQNISAMSVTGGIIEVLPNGGASAVTVVGSLNIGTAGKFEIHNNDLSINYGASPSPYASVVNDVKSGLVLLGGAGTQGITSAEVDAQAIGGTVLAVVDNGDPNINGGITSLSGLTISDPHSVLVKYTWFGDANLDGIVDGSDYALTDTGFTSGGSLGGWVFGDYDYNGSVDGGDYALQDTGFIAQTGTLPEPSSLGILALAAGGVLRRRKSN